MFLGHSQNFPDLKDHILVHCQEESPNCDAELIIDAATTTTAKHQPQWTQVTATKITASGAWKFPPPRTSLLSTAVSPPNSNSLKVVLLAEIVWDDNLAEIIMGLNSSLQES